jgi:CheY-like chemotaxis protein
LSSGRLPEDDARHALETIQRNAHAQARIVNDILDISRVVSGQLRLNVQPIHLNALIEAAVDAVRPAAEARELQLKVLLDHQIENLPGDPDRLQQVLWNLLSNAVKFTPNGGIVQVRAEEHGGEVAIEVSDSGQGIAPDFLPFVFERFRQADMTSTRTHGGLGLGLAIVRQLVELHGGRVEVHSAGRGQGATFIVTLPMPPEHNEAPAIARPQAPALTREVEEFQARERLDGVRVLLADDEVDARELLTTVLEQSGATVRAVGSMSEALHELEEFRPMVVISDLGMPGEDGYALIRRLRTLEAGIGEFRVPALALTAYGRAEDQQRALAAGFQQHVLKPIEPEELVRIIVNLTAG